MWFLSAMTYAAGPHPLSWPRPAVLHHICICIQRSLASRALPLTTLRLYFPESQAALEGRNPLINYWHSSGSAVELEGFRKCIQHWSDFKTLISVPRLHRKPIPKVNVLSDLLISVHRQSISYQIKMKTFLPWLHSCLRSNITMIYKLIYGAVLAWR